MQLEVLRRNAGKWPAAFSSMRVKVNISKKFQISVVVTNKGKNF
jgi:hypothetical protein